MNERTYTRTGEHCGWLAAGSLLMIIHQLYKISRSLSFIFQGLQAPEKCILRYLFLIAFVVVLHFINIIIIIIIIYASNIRILCCYNKKKTHKKE